MDYGSEGFSNVTSLGFGVNLVSWQQRDRETYICDVSVPCADDSPQPCAICHVPELRIGGVDVLVGKGVEPVLDLVRERFSHGEGSANR